MTPIDSPSKPLQLGIASHFLIGQCFISSLGNVLELCGTSIPSLSHYAARWPSQETNVKKAPNHQFLGRQCLAVKKPMAVRTRAMDDHSTQNW